MQSPDAHPTTTPRLLALSGIVFAVLFLVGWFASGANSPDYGASDEDWTTWADDPDVTVRHRLPDGPLARAPSVTNDPHNRAGLRLSV